MQSEQWSEFKELVRARTDIVALVGETRAVIPQRGGREFKALCPFHDDHDPSLSINPERQTYRCWVCNEGGDCFSYLQKLESLDFRGALEQLATRAGLEMPRSSFQKSGQSSRAEILEVLQWATQKYHECLLNDVAAEAARDYLLDRGYCEEIWTDFHLGYHPGGWDWLLKQARPRFSQELLFAAGVIVQRSSGEGYFDFFRGRVMFPIRNERNQTIAFGGRILPGNEDEKFGKYQNSKDSYLFNKSQNLYGIDHAQQAMRDLKHVYVVEGYTDCIGLHQVGIANTVATLGTALTDDHVKLIKRFCSEVTLIFDGDTAGQNAANKALPKLLAQDLELRLLALPEGMDPPEYLERHGLQEFQNLLQKAHDAWDFKLQRLVEQHGLDGTYAREQVAREMLQLLAVAPGLNGTPREDLLINRLANRVGLRGAQEQKLRRDLAEFRAKGPKLASVQNHSQHNSTPVDFSPQHANDQQVETRKNVEKLLKEKTGDRQAFLEREMLQILFTMPECINTLVERNIIESIANPVLRRILIACQNLADQNSWDGIDSLLADREDPEEKRLILAIAAEADTKQMTSKLQVMQQDSSGNRAPQFLNQVIEQWNWERKHSQHRDTSSHVVVDNHEPTAVDDRLRQLLQDAAHFHKQRVTRNTASSQ
ncbi:MAG: DNA primase [Planctomycetaceae bacterium]|nr:DNA primase [Planctomycetaceae bacterium]